MGETPKFALITRDAEDMTADDLQPGAVVVLNDAQVSSGAAERLGRFVERGGGLFVIAGQHGTWPQDRATVLPAVPGEAVDRTRGQAARLVGLEYGHAVFEPFRAPRSGDFSAARFYGYRATTLQPGASVLARFDDGSPALIERRAGAGRVLVWTSSLDLQWNDLAVKPIFLPFMHPVARYLAAYREPEPWLTVGRGARSGADDAGARQRRAHGGRRPPASAICARYRGRRRRRARASRASTSSAGRRRRRSGGDGRDQRRSRRNRT